MPEITQANVTEKVITLTFVRPLSYEEGLALIRRFRASPSASYFARAWLESLPSDMKVWEALNA